MFKRTRGVSRIPCASGTCVACLRHRRDGSAPL